MALFVYCRQICNKNLIKLCTQPIVVVSNNGFHAKATNLLKNVQTTRFTVPGRGFFKIFRKPTNAQLKLKDNVPDEYNLIYRNPMERYMLAAQLISTFTAGILALVTIRNRDFSKYELKMSGFTPQPKSTDDEAFIYVAMFVMAVVCLHITISRLPIRIYYFAQQKRYIFFTHGSYPFSTIRVNCKIGDVQATPNSFIKGLSPWGQGVYQVKDQKCILFDTYFRRPADLGIMLGIQRDPDVDTE